MLSSIFSLRETAAQIARARHIARVLIRNGLGFLVEAMGLSRFLPPWNAHRVEPPEQTVSLSVPTRVRHALEELGPTFIKLGQIMSTRPDILPPPYIVELTKLLDDAPPVSSDEIIAVIETELGGPLDQFYAEFDPEPIAAASIGQAHRATLHDGRAVVVKVQRPGVRRTIQADLNLLSVQARFLEKRSEALQRYGLVDVVEEFSQALLDELDYASEGRNADRLRAIVEDEGVIIPEVHWKLTTHRIITLQALDGLKLNQIDALRTAGYSLPNIAERIVHVYLDLVFVHGVFHADPHPANILVCGKQIGLVDFGSVGYLTLRIKEDLGDLLFALVQQNPEDVVHTIVRMGAVGADCDRRAMRKDVQRLLVRYYNASLDSLPMAEFLGEIMIVAYRHHVRLPSDVALLARTLVVLEGVASSLDPSYVLAQDLEPFAVRLVRERMSIRRTMVETANTLHEVRNLTRDLPRRIDSLSEQLEQGDMTLGINVRELGQAMRKLDAIGNRISFSIVVASIIMGSAMVLLAGERAATFQVPFTRIVLPIAQIGFIMAGLLGGWLLLSIIRSKGM